MDRKLVICGLDGEMSGTDPSIHKLIQIGVAISPSDVFESRIGWADAPCDPEALQAIGLSVDDVRVGPPIHEVDRALAEWLRTRGIEHGGMLAVGWAVSTFDIPFVEQQLPLSYRFLHHHAVELNALTYLLGGARSYDGRVLTAAGWKHLARYCAETYEYLVGGRVPRKHHAGDDAQQALLSYRWLQSVIRSPEADSIALGVAPSDARSTTVDATRGSWA